MKLTVLSLVFLAVCFGKDKELRLLGLQPMTGEAWPGGAACLVPVRMALEGINQHPDLLKGYTLTYEYFDHQASKTSLII